MQNKPNLSNLWRLGYHLENCLSSNKFVFPHQEKELEEYTEYILSYFTSTHSSAHWKIHPCESHLGWHKPLSCDTHPPKVPPDHCKPCHHFRGLGLFIPAWQPVVQCSIEHWIYQPTPRRNDLVWPCVPLGLQQSHHAPFHAVDPKHIFLLVTDTQSWHHIWRKPDCNQENNWHPQPSPHHGLIHQISWCTLPFPPITLAQIEWYGTP